MAITSPGVKRLPRLTKQQFVQKLVDKDMLSMNRCSWDGDRFTLTREEWGRYFEIIVDSHSQAMVWAEDVSGQMVLRPYPGDFPRPDDAKDMQPEMRLIVQAVRFRRISLRKATALTLDVFRRSNPYEVAVPLMSELDPHLKQITDDLPNLRHARVPLPWTGTSVWLFKTAEDKAKFETYVGTAP